MINEGSSTLRQEFTSLSLTHINVIEYRPMFHLLTRKRQYPKVRLVQKFLGERSER